MLRTVALLTAALALVAASPATPESLVDAAATAKIGAVLSHFDSTRSPGCAVGVMHRGSLVHHDGFGMASLETGMPIDARTVFYSGSVSKQFTAAAVYLAARDGHLQLDDPVRRFVPELPALHDAVTVRHLVHHTSGLRDYLGLIALAGIAFETPLSPEEIIGMIGRQKALNFEPGSEYLYSNSGYFLMAQIVGRATGSSLREYTQEKIFDPLGMVDTHFHDDREHVVQRRAAAYTPATDRAEGFAVLWSPSFDQVGSGGLLTTIEDLARWEKSAFTGDLGPDFWPGMSQRGSLTGGKQLDYAFGITLDRYRGLERIQHGGAMFGYRAFLARYPEQGVSIALLCNLATADTGRLSERIADIVLADAVGPAAKKSDARMPPQRPEITEAAEDLVPWVGSYWSEELAVTYRIGRAGTGLELAIGTRPSVPLVAYVDGSLELEERRGVQARPVESADGKVTAFEIEAGRVRGIRFDRRSD